jgi:cell wall assembly regulator SMI1
VAVAEHWSRIVEWLREHAPTTASVLRRPAGKPALRELARETRLDVPDELREWWSVCGGTEQSAFAEVLPPFYTPLGPAMSLRSWELKRPFWSSGVESEAGDPTVGFHPQWLPIAFDGCGDALAVDLRPGALRGCVVEWDRERREMVKPEWTSVEEMLDQVATSLEQRSALGHCHPTVTAAGRLDWRTA